ncbi:MAG TPA: hypothetical protein VGS57_13275 [Thermoanaerobaculia bacterium]|jgi:hypothetical protein|nr:hypothetical protein [Thermoanaerobaculia bacterium]
MSDQSTYVVCLDNAGYLVSLEPRKIYRRLPDDRAENDGLMRVVDESGEDYLYPSRLFAPIDVPEAVERVFSSVA